MPIENERKFVLDLNCAGAIKLFSRAQPGYACEIEQGYLSGTGLATIRLRKETYRGDGPTYWMTLKHTISGKCVEIENMIQESDFESLWTVAHHRIKKTRYPIQGWDVDFFYSKNDELYFIMAEYEMPDGQDFPETIPDWISRDLVHVVDRGDYRFYSKELADPVFVSELYESLKQEKNERAQAET